MESTETPFLPAQDEHFTILGYTDDDRWIVMGEETQDPALVLAVLLGFRWVGDA